jgi:hypothetical protein
VHQAAADDAEAHRAAASQGIAQRSAIVEQELPVDGAEEVSRLETHRGVEAVRWCMPDGHEEDSVYRLEVDVMPRRTNTGTTAAVTKSATMTNTTTTKVAKVDSADQRAEALAKASEGNPADCTLRKMAEDAEASNLGSTLVKAIHGLGAMSGRDAVLALSGMSADSPDRRGELADELRAAIANGAPPEVTEHLRDALRVEDVKVALAEPQRMH